MYEETVYGMSAPAYNRERERPREDYHDQARGRGRAHVGYAPPVERPVSSFPGRLTHKVRGRGGAGRGGGEVTSPPPRPSAGTPPYLPLADERWKGDSSRGVGRVELGESNRLGGRKRKLGLGYGIIVGGKKPGAAEVSRKIAGTGFGGRVRSSGGRTGKGNGFGGRRWNSRPYLYHPGYIPTFPVPVSSTGVDSNDSKPIAQILSHYVAASKNKMKHSNDISSTTAGVNPGRRKKYWNFRKILTKSRSRGRSSFIPQKRRRMRLCNSNHSSSRSISQILLPFRKSPKYKLSRLQPIDNQYQLTLLKKGRLSHRQKYRFRGKFTNKPHQATKLNRKIQYRPATSFNRSMSRAGVEVHRAERPQNPINHNKVTVGAALLPIYGYLGQKSEREGQKVTELRQHAKQSYDKSNSRRVLLPVSVLNVSSYIPGSFPAPNTLYSQNLLNAKQGHTFSVHNNLDLDGPKLMVHTSSHSSGRKLPPLFPSPSLSPPLTALLLGGSRVDMLTAGRHNNDSNPCKHIMHSYLHF